MAVFCWVSPSLRCRRFPMTDREDKAIRAFVALPLPESVRNQIRSAQEALKNYRLNIRWVRPENIHLTLRFLGDVNPADVERLHKALEQATADREPLELVAKGFGVFPNIRKPRVNWMGVGGDTGKLFELQRRVEEELARVGFPPESRRFKAHLTMGRSKGRIQGTQLVKAFEELEDFALPFTAGSVILYQSRLSPRGARYTRLKEIPLS